jgi:phospholipid N-methyltransferase
MPWSEIVKLTNEIKQTDFFVQILNQTNGNDIYPSITMDSDTNSTRYQIVLVHKSKLVDFLQAWRDQDNIKIGTLLGYPACCCEFFQKYWITEEFLDTTWPMSLGGTQGPKECNIMLRWLGVRAVSHLPCGFNCEPTYAIARSNIEWGYQNGYHEEMAWLEEMLDWPIQWSALHGIAEIKTPILKIITRTDATADKVEVNRQGFSYPDEGSSGVSFPFKNKARSILTKNNAFKRSLLMENQWKDNGFSTFESMTHSHQVMLESLKHLDKTQFYDVLDLGCGNAELLKTIQQNTLKNSRIHGVELDPDRFSRIKYNVDSLMAGEFYNLNMFDMSGEWWKRQYDLVIFMPGRLTECTPQQRIDCINWLRSNVKQILWYSYSDWVEKFNTGVSEPWVTMNSLKLKFEKLHTASTENCYASVGKIVTVNVDQPQFQILA